MGLVASVDDVSSSKREPKVYDHTRRLMGTPLETTWGFEDSAYALRTLRGAGYRTVGIYDRDDAGTHEELRQTPTPSSTASKNWTRKRSSAGIQSAKLERSRRLPGKAPERRLKLFLDPGNQPS